MKRAPRFLLRVLPPALCLCLYWPGLKAWFQQDDFSWLALSLNVKGVRDLPAALFVPMAQGTIRPLSERAYFLLLHALFGIDQAPFRYSVFLTQFANLTLLALIARRLTGSRLAGFLAPVFWTANSALVLTLSWSSAYNQVLCAFFMLLAFWCLLEYLATGSRWWWVGQWAAFLLGLASLEVAVVYPALAFVWLWIQKRAEIRRILLLFAASAAYLLLHYFAAPYESGDPAYQLHFGPSMGATLGTYWQIALGPAGLRHYFGAAPAWAPRLGTFLLTAGLAGAAVWAFRRREWAVPFGLLWFLILLAPVLPLRDHVTDYYLTLPAAGLALAGAAGFAGAFRSRSWTRAGTAILLAAVYLGCGAVEARIGVQAVAERSWRIRTVVFGVARARQLHPDKAIVLAGVDSNLFWTGISYDPFRLLGISDVYIEPDSESRLAARPALGRVTDFILPEGALRQALERNTAVVYEVGPSKLRGVTLSYLMRAREQWREEEPWRVDAGKPAFAAQLGPMWYEIEEGRRWMPKLATVRLRGPQTVDERLYVTGWCPPEQVAKGPLRIDIAAGSRPLPEAAVLRAAGPFRLSLRLPPGLAAQPRLNLVIALDKTFRVAGDRRDLGLVFGTFEIRK